MLQFLLFTAIFLFISARPARAETPSKPSENLQQYRSADELWNHLEALKKGPGEKFASREEFKSYIGKIKDAAAEFIRRFPSDPRRWEAKMMGAQAEAVIVQVAGGKVSSDQQEAVYKEIINAPDAPAPVKIEARFGLLQVHLVPALKTGRLTPAIESEIDAFKTAFPADPRVGALDLMRVKLWQKSEPAKGEALLRSLAKSKDPRVAVEAQAMLRQKDVSTKPLDLKFTAVSGDGIDLAALRGKVVLVDFWATWCGPCMAEVPDVVEAYKKLHPRGFEIVGISLDQDKAKLLAVTKEKGMTWPQYFDGKGWENAISTRFGIDSIPRMWLLNKKGFVVSTEARENLAEAVEKLLAE